MVFKLLDQPDLEIEAKLGRLWGRGSTPFKLYEVGSLCVLNPDPERKRSFESGVSKEVCLTATYFSAESRCLSP